MPPRRPTKPRQPVVLPEDDDAYVREETVLAITQSAQPRSGRASKMADFQNPSS